MSGPQDSPTVEAEAPVECSWKYDPRRRSFVVSDSEGAPMAFVGTAALAEAFCRGTV